MEELDVQAILGGVDEVLPDGHRSGLVGLVGRPNVGKSSLLNQMVGSKVAIVTDVPGTTRSVIRGVVTDDDRQLVFVDLPGLAKPRTLLTKRLNDLVRDAMTGVDVVCLVVDVDAGVGEGDRFLADLVSRVDVPVVVAANKEDLARRKPRMLAQLEKAAALVPDADVVPTSALDGAGVDRLLDVLTGHLREGPRMFPDGTVSDQPDRVLAAEVLREKLLDATHHEVPHSVAVQVDEITPSEDRDDMVEIHAQIFVERDSQKGIVIGKGGATIKRASTAARQELESMFDCKVFLTTQVKVAKEWQRNPKQMRRVGY